LHEQPALGRSDASACPTATRAARELLSLPMRPNLTDGEIGRIADTMLRILDS
jgi:dTDP-4-amino-4,6-dideoxygalactose transaminase